MEGKNDLVTLSALTDRLGMHGLSGLRTEVARLLEEDAKLMTRIVDLLERVEGHTGHMRTLPQQAAVDMHALVLLARASRGLKILLAGRLRRSDLAGDPKGDSAI